MAPGPIPSRVFQPKGRWQSRVSMRGTLHHLQDRSLAYVMRGVGAIISAVSVPAVIYFLAHRVTGHGYDITNVPVQLGGLYPIVLGVFSLLAAVGLGLFYYGLRRLSYPGTLVYRLTHFRF
jgi:hypothetical protein